MSPELDFLVSACFPLKYMSPLELVVAITLTALSDFAFISPLEPVVYFASVHVPVSLMSPELCVVALTVVAETFLIFISPELCVFAISVMQ